MNMNTTCLEMDEPRIALPQTGTVSVRRIMSRTLAWCMIGVMSFAAIIWLVMMLAQLAHFVCPAS
jgi:hypothetical protein